MPIQRYSLRSGPNSSNTIEEEISNNLINFTGPSAVGQTEQQDTVPTCTTSVQQSPVVSTNNSVMSVNQCNTVPAARIDHTAQLQTFSGKASKVSASQWWTLFIQWCTLHTFTEPVILNRFVFHLSGMAQQWYLALPPQAKNTLANLKEAFFTRFGKAKNSFDLDVLNIRQQPQETAEEYITRIQQMACDEDIPCRMLVNLIAKGFKPEIAEKVLDKDPETIEDLFKHSKRAESKLKLTKGENNIIASIEGLEERLLSKLTDQIQSVMTLSKPAKSNYSRDRRPKGTAPTFRPQAQHQNGKSYRYDSPYQQPGPYQQSQWQPEPYMYQDSQWQSNQTQWNRFQSPRQFNGPPTRPPYNNQHPADRPTRFHGPSGPRSKCTRCGLEYCDINNCTAFGHKCQHCLRLHHFEHVCFKNPESAFYKPQPNFSR